MGGRPVGYSYIYKRGPEVELAGLPRTASARENEGTERDIQGVGWDMSISLKLFLV